MSMYAISFHTKGSVPREQVLQDNFTSLLFFGGQAEHACAHTILLILPAQVLF